MYCHDVQVGYQSKKGSDEMSRNNSMNWTKDFEYEDEYYSYVGEGESTAVWITRDIVKSIDTTNKWVDILDHDGEENWDCKWRFNYIDVEIFPRKKKPHYPKDAPDDIKRYITWKTAHEDIEEQRRNGFRGERYQIELKLVNKNHKRGTYLKHKEKHYWDEEKKHWVMDGKLTPSCKEIEREYVEFIPKKPKWVYIILGIKRLDKKNRKT